LNLTSLPDEEQLGLTDAYLCMLAPEQVLDYERDDEGDLVWAMVLHESKRRANPADKRNRTRQEFLYLTRQSWARYVVEFDDKDPPKPEDEFAPTEGDVHSFSCVPLVRLDVPQGLWALNKIASIAVEHFNKRNALAWGEYKSLFQMLYALLDEPNPSKPITEDQKRAVNQPIGVGRVWVGAAKDEIGYLSPDPEPFRVALEGLRDLRDEMHRVVAAMALSVDNSGAALQRSGESKAMDQSAFAVVLGKLGECCRAFAVELLETISQGRGERTRERTSAKIDGVEWKAHGMTEFDNVTLASLVDDAVKLATVEIPSPTFHTLHATEIARRVLGPRADEEDMQKISDELRVAFADDATAAGNKAKGGIAPPDPNDPNNPANKPGGKQPGVAKPAPPDKPDKPAE
jgi:hypothetical protein